MPWTSARWAVQATKSKKVGYLYFTNPRGGRATTETRKVCRTLHRASLQWDCNQPISVAWKRACDDGVFLQDILR